VRSSPTWRPCIRICHGYKPELERRLYYVLNAASHCCPRERGCRLGVAVNHRVVHDAAHSLAPTSHSYTQHVQTHSPKEKQRRCPCRHNHHILIAVAPGSNRGGHLWSKHVTLSSPLLSSPLHHGLRLHRRHASSSWKQPV
jgi:hypothetical protein